MKQLFKKNDLILLAVIAAIGCIIAAFIKLNGSAGNYVQISVAGEVTETLPLNADTVIEINGYDNGKNVLVIENNEAYLSSADCSDKTCVKTGRISRVGQSIICLPHQVVIRIIGDSSDDEVDAVL